MVKNIYKQRELVFELAKDDFRKKYVASMLGAIWGFIPPVVTLLVYWFVFNVGFRAQPVSDVPYLLWLMCGLVPWFFFSDCMASGVNCYVEYSYLVKKMVFCLDILPFVKILSNLFVHLFFVGISMFVFILFGHLNIYAVQIVYYMTALISLVTSYAALLSVLNIFFRDVSHITAVALQAWVWMTPVIWAESQFDDNVIQWLKINPMFYIVNGYRSSLIGGNWFWEDIGYAVYFWGLVVVNYCLGAVLYKRLHGHFSDLL